MAKFLVKTSSESGIQGPFSGQELEQLARTAELQPQYLVSKDAGTSWQDAIRFFSNDLETDIETDIEPEPNETVTPASKVSTNIDHDFDACEAQLQSGAGRSGWIKENADRGLATWRDAAETGDDRGQVLYGCCLIFGHGVELDNETAVEWFRKAAEQGNSQGQFSLGQCYNHGDGVAENDEAVAVAEAVENVFSPAAAFFRRLQATLETSSRSSESAGGGPPPARPRRASPAA